MLILSIKKKWFNMILSGEKKEEYRDIKPYYTVRFQHLWQGSLIGGESPREICLRNGYSKNSPSLIAKVSLSVGTGKAEWGAEPNKKYYVLHIKEVEKNVRN